MRKYDSYKDSGIEWLGQIPAHWEANLFKKSLSSLVDYRGKTPEKVDYGIFLVTARNIKNGVIDYELSQEYVNDVDYNDIMSRGKPKIGDILFTTEAPLGEVALVDNENIALAQRIIKVRANNKCLLGIFLKLQMSSDFFQYQLQLYSSGSTALGIKSERLCYLKIIYPPLPEQQQIANYLDHQTAKIDELVQKQNKLIETLQEKKKSLINHVVTKGIRPQAVMFDTNVFNNLLDNDNLLQQLPNDIKYYATDIQVSEIKATKDTSRRERLLSLFDAIIYKSSTNISQGWFSFGHSNFSNSRFASEHETNDLKALSATESANIGKHVNDALILLSAKYGYKDMIVISDDTRTPFKRAKNSNYNIMNIENFIAKYALKDSGIEWLGKIPAHWEVKKLKHIGSAIIGLTYSPENIVDNDAEGILVLRSSNIQQGILSFEDNVYVNLDVPKDLLVQENDILICSRNGSRALIGKNAKIDKSTVGCTFGAFMTIYRSKHNSFVYYILNSSLFDFQSSMFLTSTINQLTTGSLNNFEFTLPSIEEQVLITDYLDLKTTEINELISKAESMVELLKEHKQSLINNVITGKIRVTTGE